jgi:hypothetical protein
VTTFVCDRCQAPIPSNPTILQALRGPLWAARHALPRAAIDLCGGCAEAFTAWLETPSEAAVEPSEWTRFTSTREPSR